MRSRIVVLALVLALIGGAVAVAAALRDGPARPRDGGDGTPRLGARPSYDTNDPVERGCALNKAILKRLWRGHDPAHAEDVLMVPRAPNVSSSFEVPNHSGPWNYLQNVPLVLYGPERVRAAGRVTEAADLRDVYPTAGALAGVQLPARSGKVLEGALRADAAGATRLILVVVWDGVGRNVLRQWPGRWPNLRRMERDGTSYVNAVVGSSPSITPATHSTLGSGEFPRVNGVTGIKYRPSEGPIRDAFAQRNPADLKISTFADDIDQALGNRSLAGMLAWRTWHLGMLGHGTALPGGDADLLALIGHDEHITGNPAYYSTPEYLNPFPGLQRRAAELDRTDGALDGNWLGHDILELHDNPAWVNYEADALLAILENEGYGHDDVTDVFVTNFKMTDIAGHQYWMDSQEMAGVLEAQDAALGRIVDYLDEQVGDYVIVVTADHGHTPRPQKTGAWPITNGELKRDVEANFEAADGLVASTSAAGFFLNDAALTGSGVTADDVAEYLNDYRLADNWGEQTLPEGYEDRGAEQLFAAAFTSEQLPEVMRCAFGVANPSDDS